MDICPDGRELDDAVFLNQPTVFLHPIEQHVQGFDRVEAGQFAYQSRSIHWPASNTRQYLPSSAGGQPN